MSGAAAPEPAAGGDDVARLPRRAVLRDQVKEVLLARILAGTYPPGSRLVETRIAQELGVSQAPVREALRDLEQVGAVAHEPFRGCSVRELSVPELLEAFPVRAALEALAARLAAARISAGELDRLRALIGAMEDAVAAGDQLAEGAANAAFHETIVLAAGNRSLERQWRQLQPHLRTVISLVLQTDELTASAPARHRPILDALARGDGDAAAAASHQHIMDAAAFVAAAPSRPREEPA